MNRQTAHIENIIFDLGGVLVTWNPEQMVSTAFPDPAIRKLVLKAVFGGNEWHKFDAGILKEEEAVSIYSKKTRLPAQEIEKLFTVYRQSILPIPESLQMMEELRKNGFGIYCLSNINKNTYSFLRNKFDFLEKFDGTVISGTLLIGKPDPRIYHHLISECNLNPETCLFIDDNNDNVETAIKTGMKGILFTSLKDCQKQLNKLCL
jgi:putative hydrolase of the HAD superfamily